MLQEDEELATSDEVTKLLDEKQRLETQLANASRMCAASTHELSKLKTEMAPILEANATMTEELKVVRRRIQELSSKVCDCSFAKRASLCRCMLVRTCSMRTSSQQ